MMEEIIRRYALTDEPHLVRKLKNNRRVAFFGCGVFHIYPRPAETVPCTTSNRHQIKIHIFSSGSKYGNGIAVSWVDVAAMEAIKAASEKVLRDRRKSLLKKLDL